MAGDRFYKKNQLSLAHLPTWMLLIGYPLYWLEMFFVRLPQGHTSWLAWSLFVCVSVYGFVSARKRCFACMDRCLQFLSSQSWLMRTLLIIGSMLSLLILAVSFKAALLPPHLPQEFDALNYHITLPRQHLILHSFSHLPWSSADLFLLPVDFALAPYWLATSLPNKFPQFLFVIGLCAVSCQLLNALQRSGLLKGWLLVFAILGSHGIGIQMGTAMLDIVNGYLLVAALASLLTGAHYMAAVEFAFFFWAKAFFPLQMTLILFLIMVVCFFTAKKTGMSWGLAYHPRIRKIELPKPFFTAFIVASIFIAGPFVTKSVIYSGTPLYPFKPGLINSRQQAAMQEGQRQAIADAAKYHLRSKDDYGHGRSPLAFIKHLWLVAVPEKGVNNKFDYPMGLPYLLFAGPFFLYFFISARKRQWGIIPLMIVLFWMTWWFGSQQARFLYIPVVLMLVVVLSVLPKRAAVLCGCLIMALAFNALSVLRAHKNDFSKSRFDVLRAKDRQLLKRLYNVDHDQMTEIDFIDAAYAGFPVEVKGIRSAFVIERK